MEFTFSGFFHVLVLLVLSLVTLGLAISCAVRPAARKLEILRTMTWATSFSVIAALAAGIGASALHCTQAGQPEGHRDLSLVFMSGVAEAMVPPVFGFVVLAVSWLMASVGLRRQA